MNGKQSENNSNNNLLLLVIGFLGIIGLGLAGMTVLGFLDTDDYEREISNSVRAFQKIEVTIPESS